MKKGLKYLVDEKGCRLAVVIPVDTWNVLNTRYDKCLKKVNVLTGIQEGFEEVKATRKSGKRLQTLKDFLNESKG